MTNVWTLATLWLGLAIIAGLLSVWLRISTALSEIVVGTVAQLIVGGAVGSSVLGTDESWVKFLAGIAAIVLTFLAGAELDPEVFRLKWKEAAAVGLGSFFLPFLGCAGAAHFLLGWDLMASWLAGVATSTTSVAVVYAVMIESGLQYDRIWQDCVGGVLCHGSRHRRCAWAHLCPLRDQDGDLRCCWRVGFYGSSLAHPALFQTVRQAAV